MIFGLLMSDQQKVLFLYELSVKVQISNVERHKADSYAPYLNW